MKTKTGIFLSIATTGTGCAIGIPIGIKTLPEKCDPLTWSEIVDTWENSWEKIANRAYDTEEASILHEKKETERIKKIQENTENIKKAEKLEQAREDKERQDAEWRGRKGLTVSGTLKRLTEQRQAREKRIKKLEEETEKLTERRTWGERKQQITRQFYENMKGLKNLASYCGSSCSEDLIKKINEAKNRAAERLEWMRAE